MSNCCKCKLLEISRLLSHADLHSIELSRTFHQVTRLLCNTTRIASFVYNHYADISDVLKLGWLPISYRRDYHITWTICKALYQNCWPTCLKLVEHKPARALRSSCERRLEPSTVPGTLQNSATMLFNSLPQDIKNFTELKVFDSKCRNHFMTLATSSS